MTVPALFDATEGLSGLVRPLLALLADACELDCTYLTVWDHTNALQEWRFVHTVREPGPPEGGTWAWNEVLCDELLYEQECAIVDVGETHPNHPAHTLLGVRGFLSVPYLVPALDGRVAGTLCGSSLAPLRTVDEFERRFELGAALVADRLALEAGLLRHGPGADGRG